MVPLLITLIFLVTAAMLLIATARLRQPLNLVVAGILLVLLLALSLKFFGPGWFTLLYLLWMVVMVGGLYGLRYYFQTKS